MRQPDIGSPCSPSCHPGNSLPACGQLTWKEGTSPCPGVSGFQGDGTLEFREKRYSVTPVSASSFETYTVKSLSVAGNGRHTSYHSVRWMSVSVTESI